MALILACMLNVTTVATPLAAQEIDSGPKEGRTRAISGDTMIFRGRVLHLEDVTCPPANSPEGLRAKALANTFLRNPYVECEAWSRDGDNWFGGCKVNGFRVAKGRNMAEGLIASGLCTAR